MKEIILYEDETLNLAIDAIVNNLNNICKTVSFKKGKSKLTINNAVSIQPDAYTILPQSVKDETKSCFQAIMFTKKQYYNNYFFESCGNQVIISFFGWNYLTNLSQNNGAVHFIANIIALYIDASKRHDDMTGCIYDFGWNKKGIDLEMRNSYICPLCLDRLKQKKLSTEKKDLLRDLKEILNALGSASKWNQDIVTYWQQNELSYKKEEQTDRKKGARNNYDVFLAHNSLDEALVEHICNELKRKGLKPWLDKEQIPPGRWFQDVIQDAIKNISSAAIIIGQNGLGKWQVVELRSFISQCVNRNIPVIPVLLPGVNTIPPDLIFLNEFNWVKFNNSVNEVDAIENLIWGITGNHP